MEIIDKTKKNHTESLFRLGLQGLLGLIIVIICVGFAVDIDSNQTADSLSADLTTLQDYNFIRAILPTAQEEEAKTGLKTSITLAQACVESDFGQSTLASKYHNLFGIKAYGGVPQVILETQEFVNGKEITVKSAFRTYDSWAASIEDHTALFVNGVDWDPNHYKNILSAATYQEAAADLQKDGYATDPNYTQKIVDMIQTYHFDQYDK